MEMKQPTTARKTYPPQRHVLTDMRFWLIVVMLAAFIGILMFLNPSQP